MELVGQEIKRHSMLIYHSSFIHPLKLSSKRHFALINF